MPYQENQTLFPALQEWFATVDDHPTRGVHGDEYSQYSHAFDLRGMRILSDLEGLRADHLFEQFGIPDAAARRLLTFAEEDIWSIRAGNNRTHD